MFSAVKGLAGLIAAVVFAGAPAKTKKAPSLLNFSPMNTAALPGRCSPDQLHFNTNNALFANVETAADLDEAAIDLAFKEEKSASLTTMYLLKKADYYNRREIILGKMKARAEKTDMLTGYARTALFLGEFQRVIDDFSTRKDLYEKDWYIAFALAQSYFRLGKYQDSLRFAKIAHKLNGALDTRWQYMLSELGLYGPEFFQKFNMPGFSLDHVKKFFPNRNPALLPFEDVTDKMGIGPDRWSGYGSVTFADLDGDHYDDLIFERQLFPPKIYKNMGGTSFKAIPDENLPDRTCDKVFTFPADYANEGRPGLFRSCCNFRGPGPVKLLKNMGDLVFKDVTPESKIDFKGAGFDFGWNDYDLDGNLDIAIADFKGTIKLYRGNGDGSFTDVTEKSGIHTPGSAEKFDFGALAVMWGDYDDDGYPDLFTQGFGWKRLYHNNGNGTFTDVTEKSGIEAQPGAKGYMGFFFDAQNKGRLDLLAGQYVVGKDERFGDDPICVCSNLLSKTGYNKRELEHSSMLYANNGDGTFSIKQRFIPLGTMGYNHGDWDNDGHQDVILGAGGMFMQQAEPYLFYHNNGDGTFTNQTPFTMRGLWGKGHGIAFGDYDRDGHLDVMLNNGGALPGDVWPSVLLHNKGNKNHFIAIELKAGPGTNGSAIGARVWVTAGKLLQRQDMVSGSGALGGSSFSLHFGLGKNAKVDKIVVKWPNKKMDVTELHDVPADQAISIEEADGSYKQLWTPRKPD